MSKLNIESRIVKLIEPLLDKQKNPTRWKILFILKQLLIGGKNRKIVAAAVIKRVSRVVGFYLPSPYRPRGIIYSAEQWIKGRIPPEMEGSWIKEVIPEYPLYLKEPNHIKNEIHPNFDWGCQTYLFPKAHLCFLKNARIVNENGVVISSDDKVFADFTFEFGASIEKNEVFRSCINRPQFRKECLATMTSTGNTGYFHWLFDSLPRLKLLEEVIDEIDFLIVPNNLKKFHLQTLNLLGFPEDRLIKIKDGFHFQCENLFVPSLPGSTGTMPEWACEFLRESFLPQGMAEPNRLIYISRKDALYRKIINEKEIEDYLQEKGFEIFQMSGLSFSEQVRIFAEARIVVAPHGAGLSNIVFCKNAKILEIFSPFYVAVCYWVLANQVGNEYYYLLGIDAPGNSPPPMKDFRVDMKDFKETLKLMFSNSKRGYYEKNN